MRYAIEDFGLPEHSRALAASNGSNSPFALRWRIQMSPPPPDNRVACAQRSTLFNGLTLAECGEIVSLAQERCFAKYQMVYRQADPVKFIFLLVLGV